MIYRIKNWAKFQHFKDRRPPWVKLYRDLLEDMEWFELDPTAAKALVSFWLIASENDGELPDAKKLAFRMRTTEAAILEIISKLSHWLEHDDIEAISDRYQQGTAADKTNSATDVSGYQETETETEKRQRDGSFDAFWKAWPSNDRKQAKGKCLDVWKKAHAERDAALILAHVERMKQSEDWKKQGGQFIPGPLVYLNQRRWEGACEGSESADQFAGAI